MSRNERANRHDDDSSDYDEEAEYIKSNKAFDRENEWLDKRNHELESQVKSLKREISVLKSNSDRKTKWQLRIDYAWDGEEANLSDKVSNWTKAYLFPRYKFLKDVG
jgi:predicted RNase H-like nuclease (RuvC/YqgF family)